MDHVGALEPWDASETPNLIRGSPGRKHDLLLTCYHLLVRVSLSSIYSIGINGAGLSSWKKTDGSVTKQCFWWWDAHLRWWWTNIMREWQSHSSSQTSSREYEVMSPVITQNCFANMKLTRTKKNNDCIKTTCRAPLGSPTHCAWIPITVKHLCFPSLAHFNLINSVICGWKWVLTSVPVQVLKCCCAGETGLWFWRRLAAYPCLWTSWSARSLEMIPKPENPVSVSPPARCAWPPPRASSPSAALAPRPGKAPPCPRRTFVPGPHRVPDDSWSNDGRDGWGASSAAAARCSGCCGAAGCMTCGSSQLQGAKKKNSHRICNLKIVFGKKKKVLTACARHSG